MPQFNFRILLFTVFCCFFCSGITVRDRVLINSLHQVERTALVKPTGKQLFEGAMHGLFAVLRPLGDDYSKYVPFSEQKRYTDELDNRLDGIGILFQYNPVSQSVEITYPYFGSPAWHAGIRAGDRIVAVDGHETDKMPFERIPQLIKGPPDTEVVLTVLHRNVAAPVDIPIKRAPLQRSSVEGFALDDDGNRIFSLPTESELAYLRITSFTELTTREVADGLHHILDDKMKGLILDLRGNPGGYITSCVLVADFFVSPNDEYDLVVSTRFRDGVIKERFGASPETLFDGPMVVLIDDDTASAAEILSACLQDYRRATIVGTRSFGKGTVQKIFDLPINSGKFQLTEVSYWRPSGRNIQRTKDAEDSDEWGVRPDPDGLVPISDEQQFAQDAIRDRRSHIVASEVEKILTDFLKKLPEEIDRLCSEKKTEENEKPEPFQLQGTPPYYDPQLEKAIEILKGKIQ